MSHLADIEDTEVDETPIIKEKKPKKSRTDKQLEQFKVAQEKRAASIETQKDAKRLASAKLILENDIKVKTVLKKQQKAAVVKEESSDESSESEAEVIQVIKKKKAKPKPVVAAKKKRKTIIIEVSDSDSDTDSDSDDDTPPPAPRQREMITQQNKKSLIKVHKPAPVMNYFAD